jgi:hypothetical protein
MGKHDLCKCIFQCRSAMEVIGFYVGPSGWAGCAAAQGPKNLGAPSQVYVHVYIHARPAEKKACWLLHADWTLREVMNLESLRTDRWI